MRNPFGRPESKWGSAVSGCILLFQRTFPGCPIQTVTLTNSGRHRAVPVPPLSFFIMGLRFIVNSECRAGTHLPLDKQNKSVYNKADRAHGRMDLSHWQQHGLTPFDLSRPVFYSLRCASSISVCQPSSIFLVPIELSAQTNCICVLVKGKI